MAEAAETDGEITGYVMLLKDCQFSYENAPQGTAIAVYGKEFVSEKTIYPGFTVKIKGDAFPIEYKNANPGELQEKYYALSDDQYYGIWIEKCEILSETADPSYTLKKEIRRELFYNIYDIDSASVLYAMVTGDKSYISEEVKEAFSKCGTSHILAVSGLHVGILLGVFTYILKKLRLRGITSVLFVTALVIFYSAFT